MFNSVSIANCSFLGLREELDQVVAGGAQMFHIDLMDGHYVPNLCMPIKLIRELKDAYPQIITDIHVMVTNPSDYIGKLVEAGSDFISFHTDSTRFVRRTINEIRSAGAKPGVVINPSQRIDHIEPFMEYVDMVTLMAVEPGFAGQPFLPGGMDRLRELSDLRKRRDCRFLINVDGGVDREKARVCKQIGVDVIIGTRHNIFHQPCGLEEACRQFNAEFG